MKDKKENKVQMPMTVAIEKATQELIDDVNKVSKKYQLTNYMLFQIINNITQIVEQNMEQEKTMYYQNLELEEKKENEK